MGSSSVLLVDSMIVIEAVRTGIWKAITGQRRVVTVQECADELQRGSAATIPGYVVVSVEDLAGATVEPLPAAVAASFRLTYPSADGMDPGERDLLALAASRSDEFELCSCDKAAVVAARALGLLDRVVSLEAVAGGVGARTKLPLKRQFSEEQMRRWRTSLLLGGPL